MSGKTFVSDGVLPAEVREVLKHEAPVAVATSGSEGPHLVGTWQSYIEVDGDRLVIPAGGFRLEGAGSFVASGPVFERTKARFSWCHAALVVRVESWERLI